MSDFFTRLAQRALGTAVVVRPVVPPVFAPVAEPATYESPPSQEPMTGKSEISPRQQQSLHVGLDREEQASSIRPAARSDLPSHEPQPFSSPLGIPQETSPLSAVTNEAVSEVSSVHTAGSAEDASVHEPVLPSRAGMAVRQIVQTREAPPPAKVIHATPATQAIANLPAGKIERPATAIERQSFSASHDIHVTIGRVEVRAVSSDEKKPRGRTPSRPAAVPSLDEYLKQRGRGTR